MIRILILTFFLSWTAVGYTQLNTEHLIHTGRSKLYFGNYTRAIEDFNMIIRVQPHLPEPYFYRGAAKLNLGDYRGTLLDLNKALEIKPFYPDALLYRGMVYYHLKEYNKAMNDYSEALTYDRENADIYNNRGICKAAMRDFEGAIEDYSKSIALKSRNYNAYLNRSIAYQITEQWDNAIDDCNQLIRIRPNSPMGYMSRGLIRVEKEDFASALRDFDMAIYLDPNNAFAYQNRGMVKQQLKSYETAIMDYDAAIQLNNRMASAYFNRGIAKEMLGIPGYKEDYDYASAIDPRFSKRPWLTKEEQTEAQQKMMQAWYNPIDEDDSEAEEETTQKIDIEDLRRRRMLANLAIEDNRDIPGKKENEEILRIQDKNIDIDLQTMFVVAAINKNGFQHEAFGYFNLIVENLNAQYNYDPYLIISNSPQKNNNATDFYKNQVLIFNQLIEQNPDFSNNYLYRGIFNMLNNNFDNAIIDFNKAIEIDEHNLLAYFMRANSRAAEIESIERLNAQNTSGLLNKNMGILSNNNETKNQNEALKEIFTDYSVVIYMNPQFPFTYFNRGNIYIRNENYFSALDEYNKAINVENEFAEAYFNRGLVKILLNDIDGAAKDLSKAGELGIAESYNVIKRYCNI